MSKFAAFISSINSTARLAGDGLALPGTLALAPDRVLTTRAFNHLLQHHGSSDVARQARAGSVQALPISTVSSNCNNRVIEVDWQEGALLPQQLFLKLPCAELDTRWFCNLIRVWELECNFYRHFAADFPVRMPQVYAIANKRSRFILLQEYLAADPAVTLFTNPDMLRGPPLDLAKRCLDTFARIHAFYHDWPAAERERRLPVASHPFLSPVMTEISRFINIQAIKPCQAKAPDAFPDDVAATYRLAMQHWDELLDWWYREPLTLCHGDSHLGNFFVDGEQMGMIDFQAAHWGKGIRDVQYFLIDSLPADILAAHEQELVRHYLDCLAREGVTLEFEAAWEQYRAFSFQTLMTIVVSLGLGGLTEKDSVMEEILRRSVAAVQRVDFVGWLERNILS
jgi:hypothetical protein